MSKHVQEPAHHAPRAKTAPPPTVEERLARLEHIVGQILGGSMGHYLTDPAAPEPEPEPAPAREKE